TKESIAAIEKLFQKEGADSWFVSAPEEILPAGVSCESCGHKGFVQETDILDVWFESGISHAAVLRTRPELTWPAELYLEGSDQHRGWFQSSLLTAVGADGAPPYRSVLTHGFLVDESKRKMSKSLGNVVDPLSVTEHLGADILRLWTASSDYSTDVAVSDDIIGQISEAYRKIRNTFRFLLGNLNDFDVEKDAVAARDLQEIDRWVLQKLNSLTRKVTDAYDSYRFHIVYREIYAFCIVVLSGFYLDVIKDTLYTFGQSSKARRSAQTAMFQVLSKLTRLAAPVLAFTAEEVWQNMPEKVRDCASVELCDWPVPDETFDDKSLARKWDRFMPVRDEILKALEGARAAKLIGNSLEAAVVAYTDNSVGQLLASFGSSLKALLIVSEAEVKSLESAPPESYEAAELGLRVMVHAAAGAKCQRCWKYSDSVGDDDQYGDVCSKCLEAIKATA
ncbi:MAG: class I tRNA ligase family protein, partial [Terriglobia bacterium]